MCFVLIVLIVVPVLWLMRQGPTVPSRRLPVYVMLPLTVVNNDGVANHTEANALFDALEPSGVHGFMMDV